MTVRRYLLWTFRCLRGRRCADVVFTDLHSPLPGVVFTMSYTCGGCGTEYTRSTIAGSDGTFTSAARTTT